MVGVKYSTGMLASGGLRSSGRKWLADLAEQSTSRRVTVAIRRSPRSFPPRCQRWGLRQVGRGLIYRQANVATLGRSLPGLAHDVWIGEVAKRVGKSLQIIGGNRGRGTLNDLAQLATKVLVA